MKLLVVLCLVAVAVAAPQNRYSPEYAEILKYENDIDIGSHKFYYEQSDGIRHGQEGQLKNAGTKDEAYELKGSYSWVGPDGVTYTVNYVADENGYQPEIEQGPGGVVSPAVLASIVG